MDQTERWLWFKGEVVKSDFESSVKFHLFILQRRERFNHSAMVPPKGGDGASLKEQKEVGLEQGVSSGQEVGLMRLLAPGEGAWGKAGLGAPLLLPLNSPMAGEETVAMEPVTIGRKAGWLRKRDGRSDVGTPAPPDPPRSM